MTGRRDITREQYRLLDHICRVFKYTSSPHVVVLIVIAELDLDALGLDVHPPPLDWYAATLEAPPLPEHRCSWLWCPACTEPEGAP